MIISALDYIEVLWVQWFIMITRDEINNSSPLWNTWPVIIKSASKKEQQLSLKNEVDMCYGQKKSID